MLAAFRQLESGNRYDATPDADDASGAYRYTPSRWDTYRGYPAAHLAPPALQDQRARRDLDQLLTAADDDGIAAVPDAWYATEPTSHVTSVDRVPTPPGNDGYSASAYRQRWLELYVAYGGEISPPAPAAIVVDTMAGIGLADADVSPASADSTPKAVSEATWALAARSVPPPELSPHGAGAMRSIAFPVLGPVTYHDGWGACRDGCTRRHEGTDIVGVRMQPLLAAVGGTVTRTRYENQGIAGAVITITEGWRYNYFHVNNDTPGSDDASADPAWQVAPGLHTGDRVVAGQIVGYMGDSGNSEGAVPHLHFEIRDPSGRARPSFWSLEAAKARQACTIGIGPWSFPDRGDDVPGAGRGEPVQTTEVVPAYGTGRWLIDSAGRVTATGDAALISPSRALGCLNGPDGPFGSDAAGWITDADGGVLGGMRLTTESSALEPAWPFAFTDPSTGAVLVVDAGLHTEPTPSPPALPPAGDGSTSGRPPADRLDPIVA